MPTTINYPALIAALAQALADIKANRPLAPAAPMTGPQLAAALAAVQADLSIAIAAIRAHPGIITGLDDILTAIDENAEDMVWASHIKVMIDALPGGLAMAEQWLPTVLGLLATFSPAPSASPIGGDPSFSRGR